MAPNYAGERIFPRRSRRWACWLAGIAVGAQLLLPASMCAASQGSDGSTDARPNASPYPTQYPGRYTGRNIGQYTGQYRNRHPDRHAAVHPEPHPGWQLAGYQSTPPSSLPAVGSNMNEEVIYVPATPSGSVKLETTIFKPDGGGPFPLVVFNHGKERGDTHFQPRSRPLAFAREFVRRGYIVAVPNRRGFADSGGVYLESGCNVTGNGRAQALDVSTTVAYMAHRPDVDAQHILVAGSSHGGLTTIAYGDVAAPGVRGLINFSGGLRQDGCSGWESNLSRAFAAFGRKSTVPALWIYGDNDSFWPPRLVQQMYAAYMATGANVEMVDFGDYKDNAHRLVGDRDGVTVWWPPVAAFLERVGLPTQIRYRVAETTIPPATGYAPLDAVDSVPYLDDMGRSGYRTFLQQYSSRAFALSENGAWAWAEGGDDPMSVALDRCQNASHAPCRLYAVDRQVVWANH